MEFGLYILVSYFNSTKVQFGAMLKSESKAKQLNFNSTKVQFGVPPTSISIFAIFYFNSTKVQFGAEFMEEIES